MRRRRAFSVCRIAASCRCWRPLATPPPSALPPAAAAHWPPAPATRAQCGPGCTTAAGRPQQVGCSSGTAHSCRSPLLQHSRNHSNQPGSRRRSRSRCETAQPDSLVSLLRCRVSRGRWIACESSSLAASAGLLRRPSVSRSNTGCGTWRRRYRRPRHRGSGWRRRWRAAGRRRTSAAGWRACGARHPRDSPPLPPTHTRATTHATASRSNRRLHGTVTISRRHRRCWSMQGA